MPVIHTFQATAKASKKTMSHTPGSQVARLVDERLDVWLRLKNIASHLIGGGFPEDPRLKILWANVAARPATLRTMGAFRMAQKERRQLRHMSLNNATEPYRRPAELRSMFLTALKVGQWAQSRQ